MELLINNISKKFPCRERVITELYELIGNSDESYPNSLYFFGHTGTGKTTLLKEFLTQTRTEFVILNCIECYTSKLLYETIINEFQHHKIEKENNFSSYEKCENLKDFLCELNKLDSNKSYIICLDNAERLRDMETNILPAFLRLQEFSGLNICTILISQIPFEKYFLKTGLSEIISIHCPQYTKNEIQIILLNNFDNFKKHFITKLQKKNTNIDLQEIEILKSLELEFFENYLNVFLNVFFRACRDLPELRLIARDCFEIYCAPVLNGTVGRSDVGKLWRHISKPLRSALSKVYMRIDYEEEINQNTETFDENQSIKKLAQSLELPYYAKYLLIAAFIASHNPAKDDKRLFVKNHGKNRKRIKTVNANAKVTEKMSTTLGPKSFTIDRLLAIFYAILDEKVGLTCNLLAQISSLVHLKFLTFVSGEANVMDGSARLQCTVGLDFIVHIGKVVGFNVRQYLCDFM